MYRNISHLPPIRFTMSTFCESHLIFPLEALVCRGYTLYLYFKVVWIPFRRQKLYHWAVRFHLESFRSRDLPRVLGLHSYRVLTDLYDLLDPLCRRIMHGGVERFV